VLGKKLQRELKDPPDKRHEGVMTCTFFFFLMLLEVHKIFFLKYVEKLVFPDPLSEMIPF